MSILIRNIKSLVQTRNASVMLVSGKEMSVLPSIANAFLLIEDGRIKSFGEMKDAPDRADQVIYAEGKFVFPCWCDSHTHVVYAKSREEEFVDRIHGLSYEEIANRGGGILNSAKLLNETPEEELLESAFLRLEQMKDKGTGAVEIKSGYGLTYEGELKMLHVIKKLKSISPLQIKATFLGAHAYPQEFKNDHEGYLDLLINQLLPKIADEGLADFIDVFCEKNYFSVPEMEKILEAGARYHLRPKVHVNQFNNLGGVPAAVNHQALSVDHLEHINEDDLDAFRNSNTMPVALPACSFFLGIPYSPARQIIDAGLPLALATDCNPGSSPSGKMSFVVSLACIKMKMSPEEAINATTINGAYAMQLENELGSITIGKRANIFITKKIPSLTYLPYAFGSDLTETVIVNGVIQ